MTGYPYSSENSSSVVVKMHQCTRECPKKKVMSHVKAGVFLICSVLVMLRHVLHVTKANPALAGVQLFLLTSTENVLYGNSCCGAELKHDLMQNLCSSAQVGGAVSQSEHS